jgi:hypothetical protein
VRKFIIQMLSDDSGNPSSTRVGLIFVVTTIMLNWTLANMGLFKWNPLDFSDMASLAVVFTAKAYSKKLEGPCVDTSGIS